MNIFLNILLANVVKSKIISCLSFNRYRSKHVGFGSRYIEAVAISFTSVQIFCSIVAPKAGKHCQINYEDYLFSSVYVIVVL